MKKISRTEVSGKGRVIDWEKLQSEGLYTKTQAKKMGFLLSDTAEAYYSGKNFDVHLYKKIGIIEKKKATPTQIASLEKARQMRGKRVCETCKQILPKGYFGNFRLLPNIDKDQYSCNSCIRNSVKDNAVFEARNALQLSPVYLDTETTGLNADAEICEIAILDHQGAVLFQSLVKPTTPIPEEVALIHGISNDCVVDAPTWAEIHQNIIDSLANQQIVIYNKDFDLRLMQQTAAKHNLQMPDLEDETWCAMDIFSRFVGVWSDYHDTWKWHRLGVAARELGYSSTHTAHRAAEDCRMTRHVMHSVANTLIQ